MARIARSSFSALTCLPWAFRMKATFPLLRKVSGCSAPCARLCQFPFPPQVVGKISARLNHILMLGAEHALLDGDDRAQLLLRFDPLAEVKPFVGQIHPVAQSLDMLRANRALADGDQRTKF